MVKLRALTGRVDALAAADGQLFFKRPGWETTFILQPWRIDGGPIDSRKLRVILGNLERETASSFLGGNVTGSVVAFWIEQAPDPEGPAAELFATAYNGPAFDPELVEFTAPAQIYPPFEHPRFGTFNKSHDYASYTAPIPWAGRTISLELDGQFADLPEASRHAEAMVDKERLWQADMADRVHHDLFALWNDVWRDDRAALDKDAWLGRINLTSVTVDPAGRFIAYFTDGGLFRDHTIEVTGSITDGSTEAGIVG